MAALDIQGLTLEAGDGRLRLESGACLVIEGYETVAGLPTDPRLLLEDGSGLLITEAGEGLLIEGIAATMAATLGTHNDGLKFPIAYSKGLSVSPTWKTTVQEDAQGNVVRNTWWSKAPIVANVSAALRKAISEAGEAAQTEIARFVNFYRSVHGSRDTWRFRDPSDWSTHPTGVEKPTGSTSTHRVILGHWQNNGGSQAVYQLFKEYRIGNVTRRRAITHPMLPGDPDRVMAIYADNVLLTEGVDYDVISNGGLVLIRAGRETTQPHAATLSAAFTFDVRCRFGVELDDSAAVILEKTLMHSVPSIPVVEVPELVWMSDHPQSGNAKEVQLSASMPAFWLEQDQAVFWNIVGGSNGSGLLLPSKNNLPDGVELLWIRNGNAGGSGINYEIRDPDDDVVVIVNLAPGVTARMSLFSDRTPLTSSTWKAD